MVSIDTSVSVVIAAILTVVASWVTWYVVSAWLAWKQRISYLNKLPCDETHWLLGHLHAFPGPNEEGLAFIRSKVGEKDGRMGLVWYGPVNCSVSLSHPETLKVILKTSEPKPTSEGAYRFMVPWLGDGLLLSHAKKWARNRRLLTPAFHFDILRPYVNVKNEAMDVMLKQMAEYAGRNEAWNAADHVSHLTLDILLRCAFSYDNDVQSLGSEHPYVKAIGEMTTDLTNRLLSPWLYNDFFYFNLTLTGRRFRRNCDYVHSVSSDIIAARRQTLEEGGDGAPARRYLDFLDVLLKAQDADGQGLTNQEIRDEADTFLFEGHDTTASGIMWALYSLAMEPIHQERCQQEVDELLSGRDSDHINWEDLSKLPYLTMCIKEALRIHVPVPFIQRQLTDDVTIDGYLIPKNTILDLFLYAMHHNPSIWKDSTKFDPSRFTADNMAKMDPHAYIPFSAGPRNCIGQNFAMHELKVVVARILHSFELSVAEDKPPVRHLLSVVMRAEHGVYLNLKPRHPQP